MTSKRRGPWQRWVRIGLALVLALLAGGALLVWLERDLPRRRVERLLARELGARVELGRLEILGVERFLLRDVVIREMGSRPWLAVLRIETVDVRGPVREMLRGTYRDVRLSGVEAVLAPTDVEAAPLAPAAVRVDRLTVDRGRVVVDAGGARAEVDVTAQMHGIGGEMGGRVELGSSGFSVAPIAALLGNPGGVVPRGGVGKLEATLRFSDDRVELDARSERSWIDTEQRRIELPGIAVDAAAAWREDGTIGLEIDPELPGIESASISAVLGADGGLRQGEATLRGMDLSTVSAFLARLPEGAVLDGRADLTLTSPRPEQVDFDLRANVRHLARPGPPVADAEGISASVVGAIELELGPRRLRRASYRLRAHARAARVESEGVVDLDVNDVEVELGGRTELPSLFTTYEGHGTLGAVSGQLGRLTLMPPLSDVGLRGAGETGDRTLAGSVALDVAGLGVAEIEGALAFDPATSGKLDWRLHGVTLDRLFDFARNRELPLPEWIAGHGDVSASGTIRGDLDSPTVRGSVELASLDVAPRSPGDWSLAEGTAALGFVWPAPTGPIDLPSVALRGRARLAPFDAVPISLLGSGRIDLDGKTSLSLPQVALGDLARAEVAGAWDASKRSAEIGIALDDIALARWRPFLRPWIGAALPQFDIEGDLAARLDATWETERGLRGSGTASLTGNRLAHRDGSRVIEGLDTRWDLSFGTASGGERRAWLDASAPVGGFLLLWGALYGDYSALAGRVELHVARTAPPSGWFGEARLTLDDTNELRASLRAAPAEPPAYEASLSMTDLGEIFRRWVHDPLSGSLHAVEQMEAGGSLTAGVAGRLARTGTTVEGRVALRDARLEDAQGRFFVRGLQLELPVDLGFRRDGNGYELDEGRPLQGRLEFERMGFGGVELEQTATDLLVQADSVGLEEGLAMPFLDGVLGFEELTVREMLGSAPVIESGLLLSGIRLEALSAALGIVPLDGTAEGYFPRLRLTDGRLEVEGNGEFSLFGGNLTVHDISGENLMSRFPKLTFSADLADVDLLQVTHTFDFGDMSGILEGEIDDCELFRWTPVRFRARFETVPRKGVPQTIHVKAIKNIAILGTGGARPGVLDRGLHRFLDRYTYSKLGITMTLAHDAFVLRGLERRGSRELFLKGKLPFSIEVVNVQPGRSIGFRSMLERVKRLDFSGETSGEH